MEVTTQVIKFYTGKTTTGRDKWDVYFADGTKATAFEYAVAAKAEQAWKTGETIVAQITEKPNQNGGAPYRNLTGVTLQGAQTSSPAPAGPQNGNGGLSGASKPPLGGGGMSPEDKIRVTKLSCISSAAAIFSGSGDVDTTLEAAKAIFAAVMEQPAVADPASDSSLGNASAAQVVALLGEPQEVDPKPVLPWAVA